MDAYLDIETTGLSPTYHNLTVVGIFVDGASSGDFVHQPIGEDITAAQVMDTLRGVKTLYTYNGRRFDLPFIRQRLGINLADSFTHRDLMYDCWSRNLYGGLKVVERRLGINRKLPDMNGFHAVQLWHRYRAEEDESALETLLEYNREDVLNLKTLRRMLNV